MGIELTGLKDISPEIVPEEKENEMDTTNRYDDNKDNEMDTTNRYENNEFPDEDMFEQIIRNAEEAEREKERSKGKTLFRNKRFALNEMFQRNIPAKCFKFCYILCIRNF